MNSKNVEVLISKLLTQTITDKELIELYKLLNNSNNQKELENYIKDYYDLNLALIKNDVDRAYERVTYKIESNKSSVKTIWHNNWVKYAAAIIVFIGINVLFQQIFTSQEDEKNILIPVDRPITLESGSGEIKIIDISKNNKITNSKGKIIGTQKGTHLKYLANNSDNLIYNTLKVPYGKRLEITLSDSTHIYLNSGSSLRYPVVFLKNQNREIFLKGEAFFDVKEDKERPFKVNGGVMDVQVLGTKFNVSSYSESESDVVLVEGSVSLTAKDNTEPTSITLLPGQMGSLNQDLKRIDITQVNTANYTGWVDGKLVFRSMTFNDILKRVERHYSIEIENENKELGKEIFDANFNNVEIDSIFLFFNEIHKIDYDISDNKILIK